MKMPRLIGMLLGLASWAGMANAEENENAIRIARWDGDRPAAVSFTFDDGLLEHYTWVFPELKKHGLKATFWIVGKKISTPATSSHKTIGNMSWEQLREMMADGQEMGNHGWSHRVWKRRDQPRPDVAEFTEDMRKNDAVMTEKLGKKPLTYCFPGNNRNAEAIQIVEAGRIGSRVKERGLGNTMTAEKMAALLTAEKEKGNWTVFMTHGITRGYDFWKQPEELAKCFEWVARRREQFWCATFADICAYQKERDALKWTTENRGAETVLRLQPTGLDQQLFTAPLTLIVPKNGATRLSATQDGKALTVTVRPADFLVTFNPHGKEIRLIPRK